MSVFYRTKIPSSIIKNFHHDFLAFLHHPDPYYFKYIGLK